MGWWSRWGWRVRRVEAEEDAGILGHLHTLRTLAATPEALSLLVEALDPEILPILGRALMRRVR